jgi:phage gp29-like protein
LVNLAHESRQKDGHLHGILSAREDALNGIEWRLSDADDKVIEFVKVQLDQLEAGVEDSDESLSFSALIEHLQSGNYFGFAAAEIQWVRDGRYIVPDKLWPISHRRFMYREDDGRLAHKDRDEMGNGVLLLQNFAAGNFIQHQPRMTGDVGAREGLMHVLIWAALFRNWGMRDWLQMAELGWKPWRTGSYDKNLSDPEVDDLKTMLRNMSSTNVGVHSKDIDLNIEWPRSGGNSAGGPHKELKEHLAREMSKAVLGATDVMEPSEVGSMAAVMVREKRPKAKRSIDANRLARTIRRHMIAAMVRLNFGPDAMVPKMKFITEEPNDIETFGRGLKLMVESGAGISELWARDMVGARAPVDDSDKLVPYAPDMKAPGGGSEEEGKDTETDADLDDSASE